MFNVAHQFRVATAEHLAHQAIIVRRLITRMGVLKRAPVIGKDLPKDSPVPGCLGHHRVARSEGSQVVWVKRFYHASAVTSTPHRPALGHSQVPRSSLSNAEFWKPQHANSYAIS